MRVISWTKVAYRSDWDDAAYAFNLKLETGVEPVGVFRLTEEEAPLVEQWLETMTPGFYFEFQRVRIPGVKDKLYFLNPPVDIPQINR